MVNNVVNVIPIIAYLTSSMAYEIDYKRGEWFIIHAALLFCFFVRFWILITTRSTFHLFISINIYLTY